MTLSFAAAARDAWRRWLAEREVVLTIAGLFVFLPMLAWLLLVPEITPDPNAGRAQQTAALAAWLAGHVHWLALRVGFELFATLGIVSLFLARDHADVRQLLRRSARHLPLFAVTVLCSWGLVTLSALPGLTIAAAAGGVGPALLPLAIFPALYCYGRVALTGPVLVAEPGVGVTGAITRSLALTHGNGWRVFGLLAIPLLAGFVALHVLGSVDHALRGGGSPNPVARAIIDALAAAAATVSGLARVLLQVSLYRRLATPRHGI